MGAAPTGPSRLCHDHSEKNPVWWSGACLGGQESGDADPSRLARLIQRYREDLQGRHYARRTVATYPRERGSVEVNAFLTHLALEGRVSAATQNQALSALLFLYRELLGRDLDLEAMVTGSQCDALKRHLQNVHRLHQQDLEAG